MGLSSNDKLCMTDNEDLEEIIAIYCGDTGWNTISLSVVHVRVSISPSGFPHSTSVISALINTLYPCHMQLFTIALSFISGTEKEKVGSGYPSIYYHSRFFKI